MLLAHLVPAYFAGERWESHWNPEWSRNRRAALWFASLGSTAVPDLDVMYNVLFRGFFGHSILWTHSLFPYLGMVVMWWFIGLTGRWQYIQTLIGLVTLGGVSHLALDVVAHSTPLFYPLSMYMVGAPSAHVRDVGLWGYLTDPIFLLEPLLLVLAAAHWVVRRASVTPRFKRAVVLGLASGFVVFSMSFLLSLPMLRGLVAGNLANYQARHAPITARSDTRPPY
ncbi:MAG: hypothetical protein V1792_24795 [Pseudomonadota bacterium]